MLQYQSNFYWLLFVPKLVYMPERAVFAVNEFQKSINGAMGCFEGNDRLF